MSTVTRSNPVEAFQTKILQDGQLRKQVESLKSPHKKEAINEIVRIADDAGYKFTAKEYEEYARILWSKKSQINRPMTEEQLILIACNG